MEREGDSFYIFKPKLDGERVRELYIYRLKLDGEREEENFIYY